MILVIMKRPLQYLRGGPKEPKVAYHVLGALGWNWLLAGMSMAMPSSFHCFSVLKYSLLAA